MRFVCFDCFLICFCLHLWADYLWIKGYIEEKRMVQVLKDYFVISLVLCLSLNVGTSFAKEIFEHDRNSQVEQDFVVHTRLTANKDSQVVSDNVTVDELDLSLNNPAFNETDYWKSSQKLDSAFNYIEDKDTYKPLPINSELKQIYPRLGNAIENTYNQVTTNLVYTCPITGLAFYNSTVNKPDYLDQVKYTWLEPWASHLLDEGFDFSFFSFEFDSLQNDAPRFEKYILNNHLEAEQNSLFFNPKSDTIRSLMFHHFLQIFNITHKQIVSATNIEDSSDPMSLIAALFLVSNSSEDYSKERALENLDSLTSPSNFFVKFFKSSSDLQLAAEFVKGISLMYGNAYGRFIPEADRLLKKGKLSIDPNEMNLARLQDLVTQDKLKKADLLALPLFYLYHGYYSIYEGNYEESYNYIYIAQSLGVNDLNFILGRLGELANLGSDIFQKHIEVGLQENEASSLYAMSQHYLKLAQKGDSEAAEFYWSYLRRAFALGQKDAYYDISRYLARDYKNSPKSFVYIRKIFLQAVLFFQADALYEDANERFFLDLGDLVISAPPEEKASKILFEKLSNFHDRMHKAADFGSLIAMRFLANTYKTGKLNFRHVFDLDVDQELKYFKMAGAFNDPFSAATFDFQSVAHAKTTLTMEQRRDIEQRLTSKYKAGNKLAGCYLGILYDKKRIPTDDEQLALNLIKKAARDKVTPCQSLMGQKYIEGDGVQKNPKIGRYYLQPIMFYDSQAALYMAQEYLKGAPDFKADKNMAKKLLEFCRNSGNHRCTIMLKKLNS